MRTGRYHVTVLHELHLEAIERFVEHHPPGEYQCVRADELAAMRALVGSARAPFILDLESADPDAELDTAAWHDGEHRTTVGEAVSGAVPSAEVPAEQPGRHELATSHAAGEGR